LPGLANQILHSPFHKNIVLKSETKLVVRSSNRQVRNLYFSLYFILTKGLAMNPHSDLPRARTYAASRPRREAADYVYQAATVAAVLLLLLTAAI
jgi:hypothetical protein